MIGARGAAVAAALGLAAGAACSDDDPCAGAATCVRLDLAAAAPISRIDQLELDVVYGDRHATTTTQAAGGRTTQLPLATAIVLDLAAGEPAAGDPVRVGVVAAGKLGASVLGTGAGSTMILPRHHAEIAIELSPTADCNAGAFYCGGDQLAGDPDTLYQCNAGGVPIARGACSYGCQARPAHDDVCRGGGGTCVDGSRYCGGDKLDGEPQTLYVCMAGAGVTPQRCPAGCMIRAGNDDVCR
jgi:hypothetical protein